MTVVMMRRFLLALAVAGAVLVPATAAQAATPPMTVTVNPAGTANPDGSATVSGTVTCPLGNTWYGYVDVWQPSRFNQRAWGEALFGDPNTPIPCTGAPQPWLVTTPAFVGRFVPGPADVRAVYATQGPAGLNTVAADRIVALI